VHNFVGRLAQQSDDDFCTATTSVYSKHTQIARQKEDRSTVVLKTMCGKNKKEKTAIPNMCSELEVTK
jgi:hypothetical protein